MKKLAACCLLLTLLLSLCACGLLPDAYEPPETVWTKAPTHSRGEPAEEPSTEAPTAETTEAQPMLSAEEQVALFSANRDQWIPTEDYGLPYGFAVTDLDQNGHLELLISVCMGTGMVSVNRAWTVNEQGDGIAACDDIFQTEESQPELLYDEVPVYLDREGRYCYIFEDSIRNGWAYQAGFKYALWMGEEQLNSMFLASFVCESDIEGNQTITCVDAADVPISLEEYEVYEGMYFSECIPMTATFSWEMVSVEEMPEMDVDAWYLVLEQSWAGFSLN